MHVVRVETLPSPPQGHARATGTGCFTNAGKCSQHTRTRVSFVVRVQLNLPDGTDGEGLEHERNPQRTCSATKAREE